jgi:hypothetical protein
MRVTSTVVALLVACGGSGGEGVGPPGPQGPAGPAGPPGPSGGGTTSGSASGTRLLILQDRFVGADGSVWAPNPGSFHDRSLGIDCSIGTAADGVPRCMPVVATFVNGSSFADSSCSTTLAIDFAPGCSLPTYATSSNVPNTCAASVVVHVFPVSGEYTGPVFSGSPASCFATTRSPGIRYLTIGAEIAASTFVAFTKQ